MSQTSATTRPNQAKSVSQSRPGLSEKPGRPYTLIFIQDYGPLFFAGRRRFHVRS